MCKLKSTQSSFCELPGMSAITMFNIQDLICFRSKLKELGEAQRSHEEGASPASSVDQNGSRLCRASTKYDLKTLSISEGFNSEAMLKFLIETRSFERVVATYSANPNVHYRGFK